MPYPTAGAHWEEKGLDGQTKRLMDEGSSRPLPMGIIEESKKL